MYVEKYLASNPLYDTFWEPLLYPKYYIEILLSKDKVRSCFKRFCISIRFHASILVIILF
jgi:hypothetical protein